jgi:hypothetical protein
MASALSKPSKSEKISPTRVLATVNRFYMELFPLWTRERMMINFYNGGVVPCDEEDYEDSPVSLGLGYRYIKKPFDSLLDTLIMKPGFLKTEVRYPTNPSRKGLIERAIDDELNAICHPRMESSIRKAAGRSVITGRAFFYRLSRWDWLFKTGRMLHSMRDGDDVYSEAFREWAFMGEINLRDLDQYIDNTREYDGAGWNRTGLAALKSYILKTTAKDRDYTAVDMDRDLLLPFNQEVAKQPLLVYWYFRKNGTRNSRNGRERIDLYCISRWGQQPKVDTVSDGGGIIYERMDFNGTDEEAQQELYYLPNAFEEIDECLVPALLDSRVDGEQELAQIDGTGKIMLPRIQFMEMIALATGEGIAWGTQPNWTSKTGQAVDEDKLRRLQRTGLAPWDFVPPGLEVMNKANSLTGLNAGMALLQMFGMSVEQDAGTGEIPPMGTGDQARFKAQSDMLINQAQQSVSRRGARFFTALDLLANSIEKTLCRPLGQWMEGDAGYWDVLSFQRDMFLKHQVMPPEYAPLRVIGSCRRLANDQDRMTAITENTAIYKEFGQTMSPQGQRYLLKEIARASKGDSFADLAYPDQEEVQPDQVATAQNQTVMAFVSMTPPPVMKGDNPAIHVPIHTQVLQMRIQAAEQQGSVTPAEQAGLAALLMHLAGDVRGLPPQAQMQMQPGLQKAAMSIQKIPVAGAVTDIGLKQQALQLKTQDQQFKQEMGKNLMEDRKGKLALKSMSLNFDQQIELRKFLEEQKNNGVDRAATLLDMINTGDQAPDTTIPALPSSNTASPA